MRLVVFDCFSNLCQVESNAVRIALKHKKGHGRVRAERIEGVRTSQSLLQISLFPLNLFQSLVLPVSFHPKLCAAALNITMIRRRMVVILK
jgi:hypothetical protein